MILREYINTVDQREQIMPPTIELATIGSFWDRWKPTSDIVSAIVTAYYKSIEKKEESLIEETSEKEARIDNIIDNYKDIKKKVQKIPTKWTCENRTSEQNNGLFLKSLRKTGESYCYHISCYGTTSNNKILDHENVHFSQEIGMQNNHLYYSLNWSEEGYPTAKYKKQALIPGSKEKRSGASVSDKILNDDIFDAQVLIEGLFLLMKESKLF